VRYRTAAVLSVAIIGGMFILPAGVWIVFPALKQGYSVSLASYEIILLGLVEFCLRFRWFLALPIVMVLFTFAAFTNNSRAQGRR
jgi:hypothetical protein